MVIGVHVGTFGRVALGWRVGHSLQRLSLLLLLLLLLLDMHRLSLGYPKPC
jgi:hypothetical protein